MMFSLWALALSGSADTAIQKKLANAKNISDYKSDEIDSEFLSLKSGELQPLFVNVRLVVVFV